MWTGSPVDSVDAQARAPIKTFDEIGQTSLAHIPAQIGGGGDQFMPALPPADLVERCGKAMEHRRGDVFRERDLPHLRAFPTVADLLRRRAEHGLNVAFASSAKPDEPKALKLIDGVGHGMTDADISPGDAARSKPLTAAQVRPPALRP